MKKIISTLILAVMLLSVFGIVASAAAKQYVTVTVYDGKSVVVANEKIEIETGKSDTLDDVFNAINKKHGKKYETDEGLYGRYITCLWDVENGGSYGYYVNDQMAMGLTDTVKAGDHVYVFAYSDAIGYSDSYSFFDVKEVTVKKGETVTLTLSHIGFDENWETVVLPVERANVTLDGVSVNSQTDANGKITITANKSGVISASSDSVTLIPPVCVLTVSNPFPTVAVVIIACVAVIVVVVAVVVIKKKK